MSKMHKRCVSFVSSLDVVVFVVFVNIVVAATTAVAARFCATTCRNIFSNFENLVGWVRCMRAVNVFSCILCVLCILCLCFLMNFCCCMFNLIERSTRLSTTKDGQNNDFIRCKTGSFSTKLNFQELINTSIAVYGCMCLCCSPLNC